MADGGRGFTLIADDYFQHADSWSDNYSNTTDTEMNRRERFSFEKEVAISSSAQLKVSQYRRICSCNISTSLLYIEIASSEF